MAQGEMVGKEAKVQTGRIVLLQMPKAENADTGLRSHRSEQRENSLNQGRMQHLWHADGYLFREEDMAQWQNAEARLREALTDYARAARSTYQGRLFAEDALQGLRMIDHCREPSFAATANWQMEIQESGRSFRLIVLTTTSELRDQ